MPQAAILIFSKDKDFREPLAEQVKAELKLACQIAENIEQAKALSQDAALMVTSEESGKFPCPTLSVKRPVRLRNLLADIADRLQKPSDDSIPIGRYVLSPRQNTLSLSGKSVDLTGKEAALLVGLAKAGPKGASREQLLKDVWGFEETLNTHTLETHIYRLRGKFKELSGDDTVIAAGGGYGLKL